MKKSFNIYHALKFASYISNCNRVDVIKFFVEEYAREFLTKDELEHGIANSNRVVKHLHTLKLHEVNIIDFVKQDAPMENSSEEYHQKFEPSLYSHHLFYAFLGLNSTFSFIIPASFDKSKLKFTYYLKAS